jgi:hypothetical protein
MSDDVSLMRIVKEGSCASFKNSVHHEMEETMDTNWFVELDGYGVSVPTQREPTGRWISWVRFERMSDIKDMKTHIPGMRRRVPTDFPSQEKAIEAAYEYARGLVKAADVGL